MKACYLIQTHKNPKQIYRLVQTIKKSSPTSEVLIAHDFTSCYLDITPLRELVGVHLLKGDFPIIWGEFSVIQPYLNAINWLVENKSDFDWLIYISGQHYPTQRLSEIEKILFKNNYDGFITYSEVIYPSYFYNMYFYQFHDLYTLPRSYNIPKPMKWILKNKELQKINFFNKINKIQPFFFITFDGEFGIKLGIISDSPPFNEDFVCYRGSQWHYLSRKCVEYIRNFMIGHPSLVSYYKKTLLADESLIQSILVNSKKFNLCNKNFLYYEMPPASGHPKLITVKDYSRITNESFHFARKFDLEKDAEIFAKLDSEIFDTR